MPDRSKVLRCDRFRWDGVPLRAYKDEVASHRGVTRQNLLGDAEGERVLRFVTRYFEVAPGGFTTFEHHRHPHTVVVLRGRGEVVLDAERRRIAPFDCVYVAPDSAHQFRADPDEPLGFLCIVDRVRDRPRPPGAAEKPASD
jgi:quercetin dioxygenase-like cupin family protein